MTDKSIHLKTFGIYIYIYMDFLEGICSLSVPGTIRRDRFHTSDMAGMVSLRPIK